jgi:hypothetical protein
MTRSFLTYGRPLEGYDDLNDNSEEQEQKIGNWSLDLDTQILRPVHEPAEARYKMEEAKDDDLLVWYLGGPGLLQRITTELLALDGLWSLGSLTFVLIYAWFYTGSFMIASSAMLYVYSCFPAAQFVNKFIFQIAYWDTLCVFVIFLLIGIGCDSCFVFFDAFQASKLLAEGRSEDPVEIMTLRLKYTLSRGRKAVGVCSGTTCGAFLANLASNIMPTAQFGLFTAVAIFLEFVASATFFIAVLVIYEKYLENTCSWCPCGKAKRKVDAEVQTKGFDLSAYPKINSFYYNVVSVHVLKARKVLVPFFFCVAVGGAAAFSQIEPQKETPQSLPPDHWLQRMFDRNLCTKAADLCFSSQTTEEKSQNLVFVWGLLPPPESPVRDQWKFSDFTSECGGTACGKHKLDEDFNLAKPAIQEWIITACERGREFELTKLKRVAHCALEDFKDWLKGMNDLDKLINGSTYPLFPAPEAEFYDLFEEFLSTPTFKAKYMNEKHIILNKDEKKVDVLTVAWQSEFVQLDYQPPDKMRPKFEAWKKFETDLNEEAPDGADKGFGTTGAADGIFMNYAMSKEFNDSVYRCGMISGCVALLFLTIATRDVLVVVISMLSIMATVLTTLGSMYVYGWELGIIEAICATLAAGFAVDYTIHFAIAYIERTPEQDGLYNLGSTREDRVRHGFFELGPAVMSGYITTCGAAAFLWNCDSVFFQVFGTFLMTVVTWSVVYAHFFFMPLMSLAGPDHGTVPSKLAASTAPTSGVTVGDKKKDDDNECEI